MCGSVGEHGAGGGSVVKGVRRFCVLGFVMV